MSGHSKWATIKRKKAATDSVRGKVFSRLVKEITVAAKMGGGDVDANPRLRSAIDAAKRENMPVANVERAIQRGTGELPGVTYEEVTYEGFGPGGVAVLVQTTTDNRRRTVAEIRKLFERRGGNLGEPNTVAWMFKQAGYFLVDAAGVDEDALLEVALEAGADDVAILDGMYEVTTPPTQFHVVLTALEDAGIACGTQEMAMLPQNLVPLEGRDAERCLQLMEVLDDHDDVQNVWSNVDLDEAVVEQIAAG
ncbi:MAG TPA: YebC/PmpR family DNA-binding transcriptional regulator [Acidobacteriota bacterium]|nr:YebC/PmpR family DNA-binding transcriptional regulator [Acidobacteriota bacterium]